MCICMFYFSFGATPGVALCSGINLGRTWETIGIPDIEPWLAVCKDSTQPSILSLLPLDYSFFISTAFIISRTLFYDELKVFCLLDSGDILYNI